MRKADLYALILMCLVVAASLFGGGVASYVYKARIAEMEAAQSEALKEAHAKNEKNLADATNTVLLAQDEYNVVRAERDRLLARLRHAESGSRPGGNDSVESLRKRIAKLEELVGRMAEAASRCGDGFERCAQKHDALTEILK